MDLGKEELTRRIRVHSEVINLVADIPPARKTNTSQVRRKIDELRDRFRIEREFSL